MSKTLLHTYHYDGQPTTEYISLDSIRGYLYSSNLVELIPEVLDWLSTKPRPGSIFSWSCGLMVYLGKYKKMRLCTDPLLSANGAPLPTVHIHRP